MDRFATAGCYVLNYSTNPGVVEVYGDYEVAGTTLTLDYATQLYTSTATTAKDIALSPAVAPADHRETFIRYRCRLVITPWPKDRAIEPVIALRMADDRTVYGCLGKDYDRNCQ